MTARRWSRRPAEVEAIQLDAGNADEVAAWADGRATVDDLGRPVVKLPRTMIPVTVGNWAVRDVMPDGLGPARAILDHLFCYCYTPTGAVRRHRRKDVDPGG